MFRSAPLLTLAFIACTPQPDKVENPISLASPLMGTGGFAYAAGSAFPGASVPHGLAKPGPDTIGAKYGDVLFLHFSGYWFGDETIRGFSQLHLHGTGATDYGAITLAPVTQSLAAPFTADTYSSTFAKTSEHASPGSYAVHLDAWNVDVELTASTHVAWHRYTWAAAAPPRVVLDLTRVLAPGTTQLRKITPVSSTVVRGSVRVVGAMSGGFGGNDVYFEIRASRPWSKLDAPTGDAASMDFDAAGGPVTLAVGLSLVSANGATQNLDAEPQSFDAAKDAAISQWSTLLERVTVYGASPADAATFYSALHHAFLMPTVISDTDGSYVFGRPATFSASTPTMSDFSLWDTYRTVHPLYALVNPPSAADSVNSLVRQAQARGGFTRWPLGTGETGTMLGSPADIVIADAALRDVDGPDYGVAFSMLRDRALGNVATAELGTRADGPSYRTLGFVPVTESDRSGSLTLEYAAADSALAHFAAKLGNAADAAALTTRSQGWRKLFDPSLGLLRARNADGSTLATFDANSSVDFAESSSTQNTWAAIFDVDGYTSLFGSRAAFVAALKAFFDATPPELAVLARQPFELRYFPNNHYWAGNEPDIQAPFMFALAGRADLTAQWSVWARTTFYSSAPEGLPGNDDGGAMASWYIFAMLGLYPVPGSDTWVIGSPAFPKVEIAVAGGVFTIEATDVSADNIYVQSLELDGETLAEPVLHQAQIKAGSRLVARMGPQAP